MPVGALETFKKVMEHREVRIEIQPNFWFGHSAAITVAQHQQSLGCNVDHLRQKVEVRSTSTVQQLESELSVVPVNLSTFGGNRHAETALNLVTTCSNRGRSNAYGTWRPAKISTGT
ncbi:hypothetical protein TNIN_201761 [Trichonephila inaurata madagascariensis]|uniref:Uncharacterized protein n=1 Tax=Trichonephila inaurata madagascariensis TaxID=2747483 RepID=A0A8X6I701_9ARAC|nr:hypothetical protein TNIN_201761 [Trichonephila inaurata madagascariensis]